MSSSATDHTVDSSYSAPGETTTVTSPNNKGKGKVPAADDPMEEEEEDGEDEGDEEEGDDEEEDEDGDEEETYDEIDPSAIVSSGRRTRGVRVDYSSQEALEKAGLKPGEVEDDDDEDVDMD